MVYEYKQVIPLKFLFFARFFLFTKEKKAHTKH